MSPEVARKVLGLRASFSQKDIDQTYAGLLHKYTRQSQHATDPRERDLAHNALGILPEAYRALTHNSPPSRMKPPRPAISSNGIARASLAGTPATVDSAASGSRRWAGSGPSTGTDGHVVPSQKPSRWSKERAASVLIYSAICLVALLILSKGVGCAS